MMWLGNDLLKNNSFEAVLMGCCWMLNDFPNTLKSSQFAAMEMQLIPKFNCCHSIHPPFSNFKLEVKAAENILCKFIEHRFPIYQRQHCFSCQKCAPQKIRPEFPIEEDLLYNSQHVFHSNQFFCLFISKILHSYYIHWLSMCIFTKKLRTFDPHLPIF